jgi:hypothetical protein
MSKIGSRAGSIPNLHLLKILSGLSQNIYIITGSFSAEILSEKCPDTLIFGVNHKTGSNMLTRIANYILTQLYFL